MAILMLSLDKKILSPDSAVAARMRRYGADDELFIVVPSSHRAVVDLSPRVHVYGTGGGHKLSQFLNLFAGAKSVLKSGAEISKITAQDPFFIGLAALMLGKKYRIPVEVQVHGDFFGSAYYRRSGLMNYIRYLLGRIVVRHASKVRVVGERVCKSLIGIGVSEKKISVRPIAVDVSAIQKYESRIDLHTKYPGYDKIFLVLGRLEPVKNISWLIDIFASVEPKKRGFLLLIVGEGSEKKKLQKRVRELGLQNSVIFEPWTNDPWSYLKTADCLLFPSLSEGYGLVVMEAVVAGTPVIMTDVGVANFEVKDQTGIRIFQINDKERFIHLLLLA